MKNYFKLAVAIATIGFTACNSADKNKFTIDAQLANYPSTAVEIARWDSAGVIAFDTVTTDAQGNLKTSFTVNVPSFYMLRIANEDSILLAGENGTLCAFTLNDNGYTSDDASFQKFANFYRNISDKEAEINTLAASYNPNMPNEVVEELISNYERLVEIYFAEAKSYVEVDTASAYAAIAALNLNPETELETITKIKSSLDGTWEKSPIHLKLTELVVTATKAAEQKKAQEEHEAARNEVIGVGKTAPDIVLNNTKGKETKLSSLRGKVVLIDFWASWCKPCRMENPNVKRVYEKYHNKGFEIFGVSLDRNQTAWEGAIKEDGLPWVHVSDLQYWQSAAAQLYMVNSIPFTVLLDKEGKVLATNLRGEELDKKLAEIFGA